MDRLNPRISLDLDPAMTADSNLRVPSQKAIKTYVDSATGAVPLYTDEDAQDAVGAIFIDSSEIDFTYTDITPSITAVLKAGSIDETKLDTSVNASLDLADSAIQPGDDALLSKLTIGSTPAAAGRFLVVNTNPTGASGTYSFLASGNVQSSVSNHLGYATSFGTQAASFTLSSLSHFSVTQGTIGASSTVTNQYGFVVTNTMVGATNNYAFHGGLDSGSGRWNFYADGTAANYFEGVTTFGTSFGYGTLSGVGGTVTQATSKSTGVILNKICGQITTHNASLGSGDSVAFRVTNSTVAATDVIMLSLASGGTAAAYDYGVDKVGSGYFDIYLFNYNGGGSLSEALVINFVVIKSTTS